MQNYILFLPRFFPTRPVGYIQMSSSRPTEDEERAALVVDVRPGARDPRGCTREGPFIYIPRPRSIDHFFQTVLESFVYEHFPEYPMISGQLHVRPYWFLLDNRPKPKRGHGVR